MNKFLFLLFTLTACRLSPGNQKETLTAQASQDKEILFLLADDSLEYEVDELIVPEEE